MKDTLTVRDYLQGKVRGITLTDDTLRGICADSGIDSLDLFMSEIGERERELSLAWLYAWFVSGPVTTSKVSDQDGDWSHSTGGETISAAQIRTYIRLADSIFKKYGLPTIGQNEWGIRVGGIRNIRSNKNTNRYY